MTQRNYPKQSFNGYLAADILAILCAMSLIPFAITKNNEYLKSFALLFFLCAIIIVTTVFWGKTQIENCTGKPLAFKPENGSCEPQFIQNGEIASNIDGIKTADETVVKLPDGIHAIAKPNSQIKIKSLFFGQVLYKLGGGILPTPPDDCWEPLFNVKLK